VDQFRLSGRAKTPTVTDRFENWQRPVRGRWRSAYPAARGWPRLGAQLENAIANDVSPDRFWEHALRRRCDARHT